MSRHVVKMHPQRRRRPNRGTATDTEIRKFLKAAANRLSYRRARRNRQVQGLGQLPPTGGTGKNN